MSETNFRIPKQTDEALIRALIAIRTEIAKEIHLQIKVVPHEGAQKVSFSGDDPFQDANLKYVVSEGSHLMPTLRLQRQNEDNKDALLIKRDRAAVTDLVSVYWDQNPNWLSEYEPLKQSQLFVRLSSIARKHLCACDADASLSGTSASEWSRYRDSQQAILNSLAETQRTAIAEFQRRALEADATARAKYEKLGIELKDECEQCKTEYEQLHNTKLNELVAREAALKTKEESFNTREARYVARQEQQKQIDDLKSWLEEWSLTKGTTSKRTSVSWAYWIGLTATGGFTIWFGGQSLELLKDIKPSDIALWQWTFLALKSVVPFAAFTSFLIYYIRWSSAWARQHAEEEFRNRSRLLDIGRSAWLLEAVRDAQDKERELPPELLKELARNLFTTSECGGSGDTHPQALSELLLHGLASIRVKSADGSEVEAKRIEKTK